GRYAESAADFERAAGAAKGSVWLNAMLGRGRALTVRGKEEEAQPILQEIVRYYTQNSPHSAEELTLIGRALTLLGMPKDANEVFIDAREPAPSFVAPSSWHG